MKIIYLTIICLLLTSCKTIEFASEAKYRQNLDKFVGGNIEHVVTEFGQADNVSETPNGNRLFIYSSSSTSTSPVNCTNDVNGNQNCVGGNTSNHWCKKFFEVDEKNNVIDYSIKGNNCRWCLQDNLLLCI